MYAEISTNSPKLFTYKIPEKLEAKIKIGQLVKIPLGKKETKGIVFEIKKTKPLFKTKDILEIIDKNPLLTGSQVRLANWLSLYYFSSIYQALKNIKVESIENYLAKNKKTKTPKEKKAKIHQDKRFILLGGEKKEEKYLKIAEKFLRKGKQVLILFADNFALEKFLRKTRNDLKNKQISKITSKLKRKERIDKWYKIKNAESRLILGTRTAIFSPFCNLGLIIIDNEFDESFKQEQTPKYNTAEVAEFLERDLGCTLILQSDIPTLENFYHIKNGYKLIKSKTALNKRKIIIDEEPSLLSLKTEKAIGENLKNKKQVVLFLNRKGKEVYLMCADCGFSPKCPGCEISLATTLNIMYCNNCGFKKEIPLFCEKCKSTVIKKIGIGTEKLEEEIKKVFPTYRTIRIDESTKKSINFKEAEKADIILGTQMVKNLSFKKTGLLVFFSVDFMLNLPTYRASENVQNILTLFIQKMPLKSKIIIKTSNSKNDLIKAIKKQEYSDFFQNELKNRKKFHYPPFYDLLQITLSGKTEREIQKKIKKIKDTFRKYEIIGPFIPFISKKQKKPRQVLIIKTKKNSLFYDKIFRSMENISITRNPDFTP